MLNAVKELGAMLLPFVHSIYSISSLFCGDKILETQCSMCPARRCFGSLTLLPCYLPVDNPTEVRISHLLGAVVKWSFRTLGWWNLLQKSLALKWKKVKSEIICKDPTTFN